MKAWELIALLSKAPAGAEVVIANNSNSYLVNLESANGDDDLVMLYGDGKYTVTDEDEDGTGKKKRRR